MCKEKSPKVTHLKIANPLGDNLLLYLNCQLSPSPHWQATLVITGPNRVAGVAPFLWKPSQRFFAFQGNQEGERLSMSEDAQKPFPTLGEYPRPENTSPSAAPRVRKTEQNTAVAALTHFPAGHSRTNFRRLPLLRRSTNETGRGRGRNLSEEGRGAIRKSPARLRSGFGRVAFPSPDLGASGRGLSPRQPKSVCSHNSV